MFGYLSIGDLAQLTRSNLHRVPNDVDLIVGIPRSGMIPAYILGLYTNRAVIDVDGFLNGKSAGHGQTRSVGIVLDAPFHANHILLVDDSIASGASLQSVLSRIRASGFSGRITTCAAVTLPSMERAVDVSFVSLPHPRMFEWNAFHHSRVEKACFDLDGILCVDPSDQENDDGPQYLKFLTTAVPLIRPTRRIGHIVSARLEKYREPTEQWLRAHGIQYGSLHLLDLPSAAERIRLGAHCTHKAKVYKETGAQIFYESDLGQARKIANLSAKPVLCTQDMSLQLPNALLPAAGLRNLHWLLQRPLGRVKGWVRARLDTVNI